MEGAVENKHTSSVDHGTIEKTSGQITKTGTPGVLTTHSDEVKEYHLQFEGSILSFPAVSTILIGGS